MRNLLAPSLVLALVGCSGLREPTTGVDEGGVLIDAPGSDDASDAGGSDDASDAPGSDDASDAGGSDDASDSPAVDADAAPPVCTPDAASSCKDDRGRAGGRAASPDSGCAPGSIGGEPCTLLDGGIGEGAGIDQCCQDVASCRCKPNSGCAECRERAAGPINHGYCVYQSCGPANEGDACQLSGGTEGVCCQQSCVTAASLATDPNNCGTCGIVCGKGVPCVNGYCADCDSQGPCTCDSSACQAGTVCAYAMCPGTSCTACLAADCAARPDGTPCAISTKSGQSEGMCCGGTCLDPTNDSANCGGCGVKCCAGTQCSPFGTGFEGVCL